MKKIITLIAMFVLSVGFLTAQTVTPTISYQAVVVDADNNLVVDENVTVTVTINYDGGSYVETHNVTTSPNAMVNLDLGGGTPVGDGNFADIDWSNATLNTAYQADGYQFTPSDPEPVEAVPYALQAGSMGLTTQMIVDYLNNENTSINDAYAIFEALANNESGLEEDFISAMVDTMKDNFAAAFDILIHYIENATANDVQTLYDAINGNDDAMGEVKDKMVEFATEHKTEVFTVLYAYLMQSTPADVDSVWNAVPDAVKEELTMRALTYATANSQKETLIIPILKYYVDNLTTTEFAAIVNKLEGNADVFPLMVQQFNIWMDEYFSQGTPEPADIDGIIEQVIEEERYIPQCDPPVDPCELQQNILELLEE